MLCLNIVISLIISYRVKVCMQTFSEWGVSLLNTTSNWIVTNDIFPWNVIVTHWNGLLIRYGSFFVQWLIYIHVEIKLIAVQFTIYFPSYALQLVLITVIQYVYLKRILTYNKNNLFVKAMPWARKQCKYFFVAWHVARGIHFTCNISWNDRYVL